MDEIPLDERVAEIRRHYRIARESLDALGLAIDQAAEQSLTARQNAYFSRVLAILEKHGGQLPKTELLDWCKRADMSRAERWEAVRRMEREGWVSVSLQPTKGRPLTLVTLNPQF